LGRGAGEGFVGCGGGGEDGGGGGGEGGEGWGEEGWGEGEWVALVGGREVGGGRSFLEHEAGFWMIMIPFVASWGGGDMRNYVW